MSRAKTAEAILSGRIEVPAWYTPQQGAAFRKGVAAFEAGNSAEPGYKRRHMREAYWAGYDRASNRAARRIK